MQKLSNVRLMLKKLHPNLKKKFRYNIDFFSLRGNQIYISGWGFSTSDDVARLSLHLYFEAGSPREFGLGYGLQRNDVKEFFSDLPRAEKSGFIFFSTLDQKLITHARLRWEFKSNDVLDIDLALPNEGKSNSVKNIIKHYIILLRKAARLLYTGGGGTLLLKVGHYLSNRPLKTGKKEWSLLLEKFNGQTLDIVVDHDMGGGANVYRNQYVSELCAKGDVVLLLGFHVSTLQYFVEVIDKGSSRRYSIPVPESLLSLAACGKVRSLIYNCAVSFPQPLAIIDVLIELKRQASCELLVTIHDYFIACPSHFLIDSNGDFCGVPDISRCRSCLADHRDSFVLLSNVKDVVFWRQECSKLLEAATEVRMFSNSSKRLLKRAYPLLSDATWHVVPHALPINYPKLELDAGQHLHIGIVGAIGKHKGSQIVSELASEIISSNAHIKITVIGTLEAKIPSGVVTITGPYAPNQLPEKIKKSGANVFLFPSICAETFSYVSHELVGMGVPFACFNLGAPSDLAREYKRGLVLGSMKASDILNQLEKFWRETYQVKE